MNETALAIVDWALFLIVLQGLIVGSERLLCKLGLMTDWTKVKWELDERGNRVIID